MAANTAIPRLRRDIEGLVQEAAMLDSKQQEASSKAMHNLLEQDQVWVQRLPNIRLLDAQHSKPRSQIFSVMHT